ncbi:hypothetical protein V6N13_048329 [Hibiscus sabdariffa]
MEKFFSRRHLHVAKLIFHASYGLGFVASLLPRQNVKASVPVIFADKVVEFRIIVIAIVFTFITALSAIVIGDNSAVARSCTLCSVLSTATIRFYCLLFIYGG